MTHAATISNVQVVGRHGIETRSWSVDDYVRVVDEFESALTDIEDGIDAGDLDAATAQSKIDEIYQQMRNVADNVTVDGADEDPAYQQADDKFEGFFHWLTQIEERIKALAAERTARRRIETREANDYIHRFDAFVSEAIAEIDAVVDEMASMASTDDVQMAGLGAMTAIDEAIAELTAAKERVVSTASDITMSAARRSTSPRERRGWMSSIASSLGMGISEADWNNAYNDIDDVLRTNLSFAESGKATADEIDAALGDMETIAASIDNLEADAPVGMDVSDEVAVLRSLADRLRTALESATPAAA